VLVTILLIDTVYHQPVFHSTSVLQMHHKTLYVNHHMPSISKVIQNDMDQGEQMNEQVIKQ
jgi:hypothetical protein